MTEPGLSLTAWLSPAADRRRTERHEVAFGGAIDAAGAPGIPATIRDISVLGFQAECEADVRPDTYVRLRLPVAGLVAARVVWAAGGRFGGEFVKPMDAALLARAIEAARD